MTELSLLELGQQLKSSFWRVLTELTSNWQTEVEPSWATPELAYLQTALSQLADLPNSFVTLQDWFTTGFWPSEAAPAPESDLTRPAQTKDRRGEQLADETAQTAHAVSSLTAWSGFSASRRALRPSEASNNQTQPPAFTSQPAEPFPLQTLRAAKPGATFEQLTPHWLASSLPQSSLANPLEANLASVFQPEVHSSLLEKMANEAAGNENNLTDWLPPGAAAVAEPTQLNQPATNLRETRRTAPTEPLSGLVQGLAAFASALADDQPEIEFAPGYIAAKPALLSVVPKSESVAITAPALEVSRRPQTPPAGLADSASPHLHLLSKEANSKEANSKEANSKEANSKPKFDYTSFGQPTSVSNFTAEENKAAEMAQLAARNAIPLANNPAVAAIATALNSNLLNAESVAVKASAELRELAVAAQLVYSSEKEREKELAPGDALAEAPVMATFWPSATPQAVSLAQAERTEISQESLDATYPPTTRLNVLNTLADSDLPRFGSLADLASRLRQDFEQTAILTESEENFRPTLVEKTLTEPAKVKASLAENNLTLWNTPAENFDLDALVEALTKEIWRDYKRFYGN